MNPLKIWVCVLAVLTLLVGLAVLACYAIAGFLWLVTHSSPLVNLIGWLLLATTCITLVLAD